MTRLHAFLASLPLAAAIACGGGGGATGSASAASLSESTPSSAALSVDLAGAASTSMPTPSATDTTMPALQGMDFPPVSIGADGCHPHLFLRTEAVSRRLNRHLYMFLGFIDRLVLEQPALATSSQQVWEHVYPSGLDVKFTVSRGTGLTYTWTLELRQGSTGDFTTVFSGDVDRTAATGPHQGTGQAVLDLTALHAVVPARAVEGKITVTFDLTAASRQIVLDAAGVSWDTDGDPDDLPAVAPRSAHYVYLDEAGKGGSLKAADQMVFLCPANPSRLQADVDLVHRWYKLADGSVHGRSDALMTGGQLTATQQVEGVTCTSRAPRAAMGPVQPDSEAFWLMKLVDGGAIVAGQSHESGASTACDSAFGAVPTLTDGANDFDFSKVSFTDSTPYPFPGM
jgi:hypothetical protein